MMYIIFTLSVALFLTLTIVYFRELGVNDGKGIRESKRDASKCFIR